MAFRRPDAFHVVHTGVQPRAGGLLGNIGLLPSVSVPEVGDITSILGLPNPGASTTSTTTSDLTPTSTSDTTSLATSILLTSSASSTSSTTSSETQTTSSTASAISTSDTSTSTTSSSTTSSLSSTTDAAAITPSQTDSATPTSSHTVTVITSNSSTSSSATATAQPDTTPKSFLQNKALSVGVITAATLVGLVVLIAIATWFIRKRRRDDSLEADILDFSPSGLANQPYDAEKGGGVYGGGSGSPETSSVGHGSDGSLVQIPPSRQMYQGMDAGYGAPAYGAPSRQPSRSQQPYGAQAAYGAPYGAYQQPNGAYQSPNNTYNNWGYGYPAAAPPFYDQAYGGMDDPYAGYADAQVNSGMTGVGAGAQQLAPNPPQRRPSGQRKPAPPLNISVENPISQSNVASPETTTSLNNPPVQAAASTTSASPPPAASSAKSTSGNAYPNLPAPSPLPDEFRVSIGSPTEIQDTRRLMVRNE